MEKIPKCINNNPAVFVCLDSKCKQSNPFICSNCENHKCENTHKNCFKNSWAIIKRLFQQYRNINYPEFVNISNAVEQTITNTMAYLQQQLDYFLIWKATFNMSQSFTKFIQNLQKNKQNSVTGKQLRLIVQDIEAKRSINKFNQLKINNDIKHIYAKAQQIEKMIRNLYTIWEEKKPQKSKQVKSIKIKQKRIENLNKKILEIKERPELLQLKCN